MKFVSSAVAIEEFDRTQTHRDNPNQYAYSNVAHRRRVVQF